MTKPTDRTLSDLIHRLHDSFRHVQEGNLATYIPELGKMDPAKFGISITTLEGRTLSVGDADCHFTLQSISKPFVFGLALENHGRQHVRSRVGVEPTGDPFHSIIRLDNQSKRPSNPLVNTGAIAMANLIQGSTPKERRRKLETALERYSGRDLAINQAVYESERETGHRNRAIAYLMRHFNMMDCDIEDTLDLYFRQCSFDVTTKDLSMMAATLANNGVNPKTKKTALDEQYVKNLLTLMFTCGLYNYAGEWAFNIGIPAKSGVSGGILAVVPGQMGIGMYSPLIDEHGNSVRGVKACEELSRILKLHVFERDA